MKVISTAFSNQEAISWEDLEHFLNEGIGVLSRPAH